MKHTDGQERHPQWHLSLCTLCKEFINIALPISLVHWIPYSLTTPILPCLG